MRRSVADYRILSPVGHLPRIALPAPFASEGQLWRRTLVPEPAASDGEPHQPVDGQGEHPQHKVAGNLQVPAHPDVPSSAGIPQGGVHPLHARPLPVAHPVAADVARVPLRPRLGAETLP